MVFSCTAKELKEGVPEGYLFFMHYCDGQILFKGEKRVAYIGNNRTGWKCDVYEVLGRYFCTGYSGPGKAPKNIAGYEKRAWHLDDEYSNADSNIINGMDEWQARRALLEEFVRQA